MESAIRIPTAIDDIGVSADLRANLVCTSLAIPAPSSTMGLTRINWVLRQLKACSPDTRLDIRYERISGLRSGLLVDIRKNPTAYLREDGRRPRSFTVVVTTKMGFKKARGQGSFIDSVSDAVNGFYTDIVKGMKPPD